jgi:hypothetical protein
MRSRDLTPERFKAYPPEARQLAVSQIGLLQQLPETFVPLLLREVIAYDWKFPAERRDIDRQFAYLSSLSGETRQQVLADFALVRLSPALEGFDWVNQPVQYSERLSAHLWATHQIDAFSKAASDYVNRVDAAQPLPPPPVARLGVVVIGQGVADTKYRLFRKLRKEGVYFSHVKPDGGLQTLLDAVAARAQAHPVPYAHWYIDGGAPATGSRPGITSVSYQVLESARTILLSKMESAVQSGIGGPEALRTMMAQLRPEEVGLRGSPEDAVMNHFQVSVLTEGSGTQIFSTTFVQWTAREALRRAQPLTILARFAPRQRDRPMNELLSGKPQNIVLDPEGSLIDGDMGGFYTRLNLQRLPGSEKSSFLVWFEDHSEAVALAPTLPRGTVSDSTVDLKALIGQIT